MSTQKRIRIVILVASLIVLAVGAGPRIASTVQALPPAQQMGTTGVTIPYPGRLNDAAGQPVPNGAYDFTFTLYAAETGGAPLWSEAQAGVAVQGGAFQALLGAGQAIPPAALDGSERWLEVAVRGPGEAAFTALAPRQRLTAAAPDSASAGPACPHDHLGEVWNANIGWSSAGLRINNSANGPALWGYNTGGGNGVRGESSTSIGVYGWSESSPGVTGRSTYQRGVEGYGSSQWAGVYGNGGTGVRGESTIAGGTGVKGESTGTNGIGVEGIANTGSLAVGVYGASSSGWAGKFDGHVLINGLLTKGGGGFKIDHPLDPANKYLNHSFVESPDMKNVYDGVAVLDANGEAWVELPAWFEALNKDFRYQLTPIGAPGPNLYIAQEIQNNRFQIAGGTPGLKVSWQVTGIRHDPFAEAHPIPVEEDKPAEERGTYLHPVEQGQPETSGLDYRQNQGPATGGER